jgi:Tol biopolymer transport system component
VWAEDSYGRLATELGIELQKRIPLIVYSSHQAFQQTNVTQYFLPEGIAGLTEFVKGRVLMPFNGSYAQFRGTLHHELVHVFQLALTSATYQKHVRFNMATVPLWFSEGMADYLGEEWNGIGEMVLADFVLDGNLPPIDELWRYNGTFALYKLGQSLVGFLVETYGTDVLPRLYESLWVSAEFSGVLEHVTGEKTSRLSERWHQRERRTYYPRVLDREPISLKARSLTSVGANFKPIELPDSLQGGRRFLFVSPRSGYTNIYAASREGTEKNVQIIVEGEREAQFESLHPFVSKIDVTGGKLAFVSKWHDRDALLIYDLHTRSLLARHQFEGVVALASPSWSADGTAIVFEGVTEGAYSDLYLFELDGEVLTRLTSDVYEDRDPDFIGASRRIVFSSDRTEFGESGAHNLFVLDPETGRQRYLTRGDWEDTAPRSSVDGRVIYFSSTRSGTPDLYSVDLEGNGSRLTRFLTGAFDPSPSADGTELLFTGFANGGYQVYALALQGEPTETFALGDVSPHVGWALPDPSPRGKADAARYQRSFSLDFAAGGTVFDPALTDAQGAQLAFTDLLGDEALYAQIGNTAERGSTFIDRMNVGVSYLNLHRRLNYGLSVFHFAGDFRDDRDLVFFERRAGMSLLANYAFSKFRRIESSLGLAYSDKRNDGANVDRRAYLATNYLSWVHDNSLWIATGPIDGTRIKATFGLTVDLPRAEVENVQLLVDWRRYHRTGLQSTWATRALARFAHGSDPRFWTLGGTHSLRGYPRRELFGTRAILVNNEFRFPVIRGFLVGFPFGTVEFPGIEGAFFVDAGWLWNDSEPVPWPPLGSFGTSLRMGFGGLLVFRFDIARQTDFRSIGDDTKTEFFVGWDY